MKPLLDLDNITGREISTALEKLYTTVDLAIYSPSVLAQEICRSIYEERMENGFPGGWPNEQP